MLAKRLSNLSCNREEFANTDTEYEEAMHKSELKYEMNPIQSKEELENKKSYASIHNMANMFASTSVENCYAF